jgi:hypothetical protein
MTPTRNNTNDPLSPTAREVYDAFNRVGFINEPSFETDRKALAAALFAVADQVTPAEPLVQTFDYCCDYSQHRERASIRHKLLTVANELENNDR